MSGTEAGLRTLDGELAKSLEVLRRISSRLAAFERDRLAGDNPTQEDAMVVAQYLSNYYTCCETALFRVSRHFENALPPERWHQALLEKMALEIPGIRPRLLTDSLRGGLLEMLKFRHFTRYYFELDYDWDKLRFLLKKFHPLHTALSAALDEFRRFLADCLRQPSQR